jgi:hypothetical protein
MPMVDDPLYQRYNPADSFIDLKLRELSQASVRHAHTPPEIQPAAHRQEPSKNTSSSDARVSLDAPERPPNSLAVIQWGPD